MDTNKILSADLLDLIFDDRNKTYGAYDLRRTYPQRIKRALIFTGGLALLVVGGTVLASYAKPSGADRYAVKEVVLKEIKDEKEPEKIIPPEKKPEQQPVHTERLTTPVIVEHEVDEPMPTPDDLANAKIGTEKIDGPADEGLAEVKDASDKGILETKPESNEPFTSVEVPAKFNGNWERFLLKTLNPAVPADNGAPAGRHRVVIQFVVDTDGSVSSLVPLTSIGYGLEEEAIRALKKAKDWIPAFQNGKHVKAYHRQVIVFDVQDQ